MSGSLYINEHGAGRFTVEEQHSSTPLTTQSTQQAAIDWAKKNHPDKALHVARVRHLSDKRVPDHWRKI